MFSRCRVGRGDLGGVFSKQFVDCYCHHSGSARYCSWVLADHYFFTTVRQRFFAWSTRRRGEEDAVGIDEREEREEGEKEMHLGLEL
jgi:hypothetical protein